MRQTTRLGAYGVLRDDADRVLLQRSTDAALFPGSFWLPGGGVEHGEHPAEAVVREFLEETGLRVEVGAPLHADGEVSAFNPRWRHHHLAVVYDVKLVGGDLVRGVDETRSINEWRTAAEIQGAPLPAVTARVMGVTGAPLVPAWELPDPPPPRPGRRQRFGSYAWATDPDGRVLLTRIAEGCWGAGLWHLPGGGIDFGESPERGLLREIHEETNQDAVLDGLRCVGSKHDARSVGDDGEPEDVQGVSIVYDATIESPSPLRIVDVGGSTSDVRWFHPEEIAALPLTLTAKLALGSEPRRTFSSGWHGTANDLERISDEVWRMKVAQYERTKEDPG